MPKARVSPRAASRVNGPLDGLFIVDLATNMLVQSLLPWTSGQPGRVFWEMPDGITLCIY
jgi:hypothetical protein